MNRIKTVLNGKKGIEKILLITKSACSIFVIILVMMQLMDIGDKSINVSNHY